MRGRLYSLSNIQLLKMDWVSWTKCRTICKTVHTLSGCSVYSCRPYIRPEISLSSAWKEEKPVDKRTAYAVLPPAAEQSVCLESSFVFQVLTDKLRFPEHSHVPYLSYFLHFISALHWFCPAHKLFWRSAACILCLCIPTFSFVYPTIFSPNSTQLLTDISAKSASLDCRNK